jgi:mono/diheme cytochrome c family protein
MLGSEFNIFSRSKLFFRSRSMLNFAASSETSNLNLGLDNFESDCSNCHKTAGKSTGGLDNGGFNGGGGNTADVDCR